MKWNNPLVVNGVLAFACIVAVGFAPTFRGGWAAPSSSNTQVVTVDTAGVHTDPVYANANDVVQWTSGGATFTIFFQNSPWGSGSGTYRSSGNPPSVTSAPFPACSGSSCDYKYTLEIGGKTYDPHVIIVP